MATILKMSRDKKPDNLPRWTIDAVENHASEQISNSLPAVGERRQNQAPVKKKGPPARAVETVPPTRTAGATLKDLCAADKKRVAKLITELASVTELKELAAKHLQEERTVFEAQLNNLQSQLQSLLKSREDLDSEYKQSLDLLQRYRNQLLTQEGALAELRSQYASQTSKLPEAFSPTAHHQHEEAHHPPLGRGFKQGEFQPLLPEPDWAEIPAYVHTIRNGYGSSRPVSALHAHSLGGGQAQPNSHTPHIAYLTRSDHERMASTQNPYYFHPHSSNIPGFVVAHDTAEVHCEEQGSDHSQNTSRTPSSADAQLHGSRSEFRSLPVATPAHVRAKQSSCLEQHRPDSRQPGSHPFNTATEAYSKAYQSAGEVIQSGSTAGELPSLPDRLVISLEGVSRHAAKEIQGDIVNHRLHTQSSSPVTSWPLPAPLHSHSQPDTDSSVTTNERSGALKHLTRPAAGAVSVHMPGVSMATDTQRQPVGPGAESNSPATFQRDPIINAQTAALSHSPEERISQESSLPHIQRQNYQTVQKGDSGRSYHTACKPSTIASSGSASQTVSSKEVSTSDEASSVTDTAGQHPADSQEVHREVRSVSAQATHVSSNLQQESGRTVAGNGTTLLAWPQYGSVGSLQSGKAPLARSSPQPVKNTNVPVVTSLGCKPTVDEDSLLASMILNDCPGVKYSSHLNDTVNDDNCSTVGDAATILSRGRTAIDVATDKSTLGLWSDNLLDVVSQLEKSSPDTARLSPSPQHSRLSIHYRQGRVAHVLRCSQRIHNEDKLLGNLFFHV